jgi:predicted homoserine dehydrogenase-like protein
MKGLPLGLAHGIKVTRPVKAGQSLSWDDVERVPSKALDLRDEMLRMFA